MSQTVFDLPPFRVGPYLMKPKSGPMKTFADKRRLTEHDWTNGILWIADHVSNRVALERLTLSLITAIHYRSGLNNKSDEESFTHSLSTGLVEIAHTSPRFWMEFNQLLEDEYKPGAGWGRSAGGSPAPSALTIPKRIVFENKTCNINVIPDEKWEDKHAYGFYWLKQGKIDILESVHSSNLALILIHEVFHFLHECLGLKDSTKEIVFRRTQATMLIRFIYQNPKFWAWWLNTARQHLSEEKLAA